MKKWETTGGLERTINSFFDAVIYVAKRGIPGRHRPIKVGKSNMCSDGLIKRGKQRFARPLERRQRNRSRAIGRSRSGPNIKVHLGIDANARLVEIRLSPRHEDDGPIGRELG